MFVAAASGPLALFWKMNVGKAHFVIAFGLFKLNRPLGSKNPKLKLIRPKKKTTKTPDSEQGWWIRGALGEAASAPDRVEEGFWGTLLVLVEANWNLGAGLARMLVWNCTKILACNFSLVKRNSGLGHQINKPGVAKNRWIYYLVRDMEKAGTGNH